MIADTAECRLARNHYVSYVVVKTNNPKTLEADKARLMRSVRDISSGGVWTIEKGEEFGGLHINMIIASERPLRIKRIEKTWGHLGEVYAEPVYDWMAYWREVSGQLDDRGKPVYKQQLDDFYTYWSNNRSGKKPAFESYERASTSVRSVAAYSSKQEGYPSKEEYSGRIYGAWGGKAERAYDLLTSEKMQSRAPIVGGFALLNELQLLGALPVAEVSGIEDLKNQLAAASGLDLSEYVYWEGKGIVEASKLPPTMHAVNGKAVPNGKKLVKTPVAPKGRLVSVEPPTPKDLSSGNNALSYLKNSFK